mgnify:CR=1 FL=1
MRARAASRLTAERLGRLGLIGRMALDEVAARRVIGELARELGLSDREAAEGVITLINANMANAIRSRTVQKGIDPRNYVLVDLTTGLGPITTTTWTPTAYSATMRRVDITPGNGDGALANVLRS